MCEPKSGGGGGRRPPSAPPPWKVGGGQMLPWPPPLFLRLCFKISPLNSGGSTVVTAKVIGQSLITVTFRLSCFDLGNVLQMDNNMSVSCTCRCCGLCRHAGDWGAILTAEYTGCSHCTNRSTSIQSTESFQPIYRVLTDWEDWYILWCLRSIALLTLKLKHSVSRAFPTCGTCSIDASSPSTCVLRSATHDNLVVPLTSGAKQISIYGERVLSVAAPRLWNALPLELRLALPATVPIKDTPFKARFTCDLFLWFRVPCILV